MIAVVKIRLSLVIRFALPKPKYCPNVGKDVQKAMSQPLAAAHNAVEAGLVFYCWNPIMRIQWTASLQNLYSYFF